MSQKLAGVAQKVDVFEEIIFGEIIFGEITSEHVWVF